MKISWVPIVSPLSKINPIVKVYLLLFVILLASFFSNIEILIFTTFIILVILLLSKIPVKLLQTLRTYLILLVPFISFLSLIEHGISYIAVKTMIITYIRFFNVIIVGSIYSYTTNPTDIALILLSNQVTKKIGIALSASLGGLMFLEQKIKNIISLQRLRGVEFSINPLNFKRTFLGLKAVMVPIILQSINISQDYANAMIARGYDTNRKIMLPPHLKISKIDFILLLFGTFYLIYILHYF